MANFEIWHNPRCSKSRQTLARLEDAGVTPTIFRYLDEPVSAGQLRAALKALGFDDPRALMRTKEAVYKELGLAEVSAPEALISAMVANPILIERPLVIRDGAKAALGRPPEQIDALL